MPPEDPPAKGQGWAERLRQIVASSRLKGISAYPSMASLNAMDAINRSKAVCQHSHYQNHCVIYALRGLVRGAVVGYGLRSVFTLGLSAFSPRMLKQPLRVVLDAVLSRRSARFGAFLGVMGFVYRNLQCTLCKVTGRPSKRSSAAAAFVAALAVLLETPEQRSTLGSYLFVRAVYEAVRTLVFYGHVTPVPHALPVVFGLCQVPIMFSFIRRPAALPRGYLAWISKMGGMPRERINHVMGFDKPFNPCRPVFHEHSCAEFNARKFVEVLGRGTLVYAPVHLIPPLLFKWKHLRPLEYVTESLVAIARSSLFLGTYVGITSSSLCFWRWYLQRNSSGAVRLGGFMTGLALLFEHPRRHAEMVQYVVPRAVQTLFNLHHASLPRWLNWLRESGHGDTLLFCSAMSMFVFAADTQPRLKGLNATIFRLLFGHGTAMLRPSAPPSPVVAPARAPCAPVPALAGSGAREDGDE